MDHGSWILDHGSWTMDHGSWQAVQVCNVLARTHHKSITMVKDTMGYETISKVMESWIAARNRGPDFEGKVGTLVLLK
jgi:hypothetical protein